MSHCRPRSGGQADQDTRGTDRRGANSPQLREECGGVASWFHREQVGGILLPGETHTAASPPGAPVPSDPSLPCRPHRPAWPDPDNCRWRKCGRRENFAHRLPRYVWSRAKVPKENRVARQVTGAVGTGRGGGSKPPRALGALPAAPSKPCCPQTAGEATSLPPVAGQPAGDPVRLKSTPCVSSLETGYLTLHSGCPCVTKLLQATSQGRNGGKLRGARRTGPQRKSSRMCKLRGSKTIARRTEVCHRGPLKLLCAQKPVIRASGGAGGELPGCGLRPGRPGRVCLVPGKCAQRRSYTASVPNDFRPGDCPVATQRGRTPSLRGGAVQC